MIKKNYLIWNNLMIVILFLFAFLLIQYNDTRYYNELAMEQVKNDAKLASDNIRVELESVTAQQRIVSETMANDLYLRKWLKNEPDPGEQALVPKTLSAAWDVREENQPYDYYDLYLFLKQYQKNYGYTNVFLVSAKTGCYYYNGGLNKVIHRRSHFDSWYYNFVDLGKSYDIQFDRDETKDYRLSVFVNYRITDENGKLLGVVGTAQDVTNIDRRVYELEREGNLRIYITNMGNAHNSFTESRGYYKTQKDLAELFHFKEEELKEFESRDQIIEKMNHMISISPVPSLNWCIISDKNTEQMMHTFVIKSRNSFLYMLLNVVISGCISMFMMGRTNRNLVLRANMDETTRLPNRKYFRYIFDKKVKRGKRKVHSLAMVDVDNFKTYNDTHGHLYGNTILTFVAKSMKEAFDRKGVVARWGGDEFILLSYMSPAMTKAMIDDLNEYLKKQNRLESISLSVGITIIDPKHSLEELMENADKALYAAKTAGKGCSMIY